MSWTSLVIILFSFFNLFMGLRIVYYCGKFQGMRETHVKYMKIIKENK